ncbi:hypothetical protein AB1Y20_014096 [Prymnesium parvum]|uniref:Uncharacterized protein n=1 Tax=Prymnesium parvum TaxID=97485 RepID=A0AB34IF20_PRYPA
MAGALRRQRLKRKYKMRRGSLRGLSGGWVRWREPRSDELPMRKAQWRILAAAGSSDGGAATEAAEGGGGLPMEEAAAVEREGSAAIARNS